MLKDTEDTLIEDDVTGEEASEIYCTAGRYLVTRTDWRMTFECTHEHTLFNPAGVLFRVLCFKEALGDATTEFSWFDGHAWRITFCGGCATHLGWRFEGTGVFFGLVKPKLAMRKPGQSGATPPRRRCL